MNLLYLGILSSFIVLQLHARATNRAQYPPDEVDLLGVEGLKKLAAYQAQYDPDNPCTVENAVKRREWGDLSGTERIAYTDAVLCLQAKPPITPPQLVPGARGRFDDFIATHMNETPHVHGSANFLGWHRYFIHTYEKALRDECGYTGYQPYWNWARYADDPINSPLFDGSATSIGGNGAYYSHTGVPTTGPPPYNIIPPAVGGGCVTSGPFKNMSVNLGPYAPTMSGLPRNSQANGYGYNPRCLRRDVNVYSAESTKANYTYNLITSNPDIYWFQTIMQGEFADGIWGVHTGGHFTISGDPGGDVYVSPGDPGFYFHHGMIDRIWWIWQIQDWANRKDAISGTITWNNVPPSRNGTLNDLQDIGFNAGPVPLKELMSTLGGLNGELCYIYV